MALPNSIPTRTVSDSNSSSDINKLQENAEYLDLVKLEQADVDNIEKMLTRSFASNWFLRVLEANAWIGIVGNGGTIVAVSSGGTHRVSQSIDYGITWTARTAAEANTWKAICYGKGLYIVVASDGTHRVMSSPTGEIWSTHTAAEANPWCAVAYGNGRFIAIASSGTNRVMHSDDGSSWSAVSAAEANSWVSICWANIDTGLGNGRWVAVASDGTNQVMYSDDNGATWISADIPGSIAWSSVTYGLINGVGTFLAVGGNYTCRSLDGISWIVTLIPGGNTWKCVCYENEIFMSIADNAIARSEDGITWIPIASPEDNAWVYGCGNGVGQFFAVSNEGTNRLMYTFRMVTD